jgi:hypothetical protein
VYNTEYKLYVHTDTTTDYIDKRLTDDRPDLSSERAPQVGQDCNFQRKKISLVKSPRLGSTQRLTDCQLQSNADADAGQRLESGSLRRGDCTADWSVYTIVDIYIYIYIYIL